MRSGLEDVGCLQLLNYRFLPRNYAFVFSHSFRDDFLEAISDEMVKLDDDGYMAEKRQVAWEGHLAANGTMSTCSWDQSQAGSAVGLQDVWTLFVVLGASGLLALAVSACIKRRPKQHLPRVVPHEMKS
jgi:hypothetical protein